MKTVCKKLLTFMLVAVMLVSAVPFQAFAAEKIDASISVPVDVYINDKYVTTKSITLNENDSKTLSAQYGMDMLDVKTNRSFVKWASSTTPDCTDNELRYTWLSDMQTNNADGFKAYKLSLYLKEEIPVVETETWTIQVVEGSVVKYSDNTVVVNQGEIDKKLGELNALTLANVSDKEYTASGWNKNGKVATATISKITPPAPQEISWTVSVSGDVTKSEVVKAEEGKQPQLSVLDFAGVSGEKYNATEWTVDNTNHTMSATVTIKEVTPPTPVVDTMTINLYKVGGDTTPWKSFTVKENDSISFGGAPSRNGYDFDGYFTANSDGTGDHLSDGYVVSGLKFRAGATQNWYAKWTPGTGSISNLKVYVRRYSGGIFKGDNLILTKSLQNGTMVLDWLTTNSTVVSDALQGTGYLSTYDWDGKYYDYTSGNPLTSQAINMDGTQSVMLKLNAKNEANVLLYVHKSLNAAGDIYEMPGYLAGETVNREEVALVIQKHYTGKDMKLEGLYSDDAWTQLKSGNKNPTKANGIAVPASGTLRIHVLLTNGTATSGNSGSSNSSSSSSGNADTNNPKTGDSIFMAYSVLGLSAAALAAVYFFEKKRIAR